MQKGTQLFIRPVQVFLTVAKTLSFSTAAGQLGMSQSGVSMAVASLEKLLGVTLFDRGRPLVLTAEGAMLLHSLDDLAGRASKAVDAIAIRQNRLPVLRLGVIDSIRDVLGISLIAELKRIASKVSLISGTSDQLIADLKQGLLDIAVAGDVPEAASAGLHKHFLIQEETIVIFPKSLAQGRDFSSWERIRFSGLPLIRYSHSWSNQKIIEELGAKQHFEFETIIDVDSNRLMLDLVAGAQGWAATHPLCLLSQPSPCRDIGIVSPVPPLEGRDLYVFHPRRLRSEYTGIVEQLVRKRLEDSRSEIAAMTARMLGRPQP